MGVKDGRGYQITPKWGMKAPPTRFVAIFDPQGVFIPPKGWLYPPICFLGGGYHPFGVVLSPLFGDFTPPPRWAGRLSPFLGGEGWPISM